MYASTTDPSQSERDTKTVSKVMEKEFHANRNFKNWGSNTYMRQNKL